ncbi:MAG TPA: DUF4911 domain-containing protein [Candidatus Sumerlaeota bacterium]|nr:DUF4911 domain-containing protein [Candidatus Sumerlaeota bacterium]HMZ51401.1 DUF4911 domain-containing protein [Candidatus Sumerlaeota bacterium]
MQSTTRTSSENPRCVGDEGWRTFVVIIPPREISFFSSVLEAYDNHFLVRTYDKAIGLVYVWYGEDSEDLLMRVMTDFRAEFPVKEMARHCGMVGLDEVYPE